MAHEAHHHHIVPKKVLLTVFGGLVFLTVLTVFTSRIDLGAFNLPLALAIALTKTSLVLAFFMALKYDNRVNTLVFSIGAIFVVVFLVFTLLDTAMRGSLGMMEAGTIADQEQAEAGTAVARAPEAEAPVAPADTSAAEAPAEAVPAPDGATVFATYLCNSCHSLDGSASVGPTLQGIGSRLSREQIVESIQEPDAVVAEGFTAGVMSATLNATQFSSRVTPEELDALVDYLMAQQ